MNAPRELAQKFHEIYERLAPSFNYETRKESAVVWDDVPENNKSLMIAVCEELNVIEYSHAEKLQEELTEWKRKATECQGILNMELHDKIAALQHELKMSVAGRLNIYREKKKLEAELEIYKEALERIEKCMLSGKYETYGAEGMILANVARANLALGAGKKVRG